MIRTSATVLLAARDEQETIGACVRAYGAHPRVSRVLVVANGCTDETASEARRAGASVLELADAGKGLAIAAGARAIASGLVVGIDADAQRPSPATVAALLADEPTADRLIKGVFDRSEHPGPVTDMLVKPCLALSGHPAASLEQPLSGLFACDVEWLASLSLPAHFGVDLAIVLAAFSQDVQVVEVPVGEFTHRCRPWSHYKIMAREVASVLREYGVIRRALDLMSEETRITGVCT